MTWGLYFKAPAGKFPCPSCGARLAGKHHWWYWPLLVLGCCAFGLPLAGIALVRFGWMAGLGAWIAGSLVSGLPVDKFLESRFTILKIQHRPGESPPGV